MAFKAQKKQEYKPIEKEQKKIILTCPKCRKKKEIDTLEDLNITKFYYCEVDGNNLEL